jgi:hypothetical protein
MKFVIASFIVMLVYFFNTGSPAKMSASNPVQLSIANQNVSNRNEMILTARLLSKWQKPIAIPRHLSWGMLKDSASNSFFLVEIQRKVDGNFREILLDSRIDNLPGYPVDSLQEGDSVVDHSFSMHLIQASRTYIRIGYILDV